MKRRDGFTLVELLVTIAIIVILAGALLISVFMAQASAREAKTLSTVQKIDAQMRSRWESYATRPLPEDPVAIAQRAGFGTDAQGLALARLFAKREMMRMELPERWTDITSPAQYLDPDRPNGGRTSVATGYFAWYSAQSGLTEQHQSAECLYLILNTAMPGAPPARELFREDEVGDADDDGAPEFHDAWGNPIAYMRWPSGFTPYSEIQQLTQLPEEPSTPAEPHDPLDVLMVDLDAYALYPLIYSAGPDGKLGLEALTVSGSGGPFSWSSVGCDPFSPDATSEKGQRPGGPVIESQSADGTETTYVETFFDNVHNHTSGVE